jgi:hypothetical protein
LDRRCVAKVWVALCLDRHDPSAIIKVSGNENPAGIAPGGLAILQLDKRV